MAACWVCPRHCARSAPYLVLVGFFASALVIPADNEDCAMLWVVLCPEVVVRLLCAPEEPLLDALLGHSPKKACFKTKFLVVRTGHKVAAHKREKGDTWGIVSAIMKVR